MQDSMKPSIWPATFRRRWNGTQPGCGMPSCSRTRSLWQLLWRKPSGALLQGMYFCADCLGAALTAQLKQLDRWTPKVAAASRIPLGLLMVARGRLTYTEVLAALDAQRRARHGTIGEWIEKLGFATEQEVTSALGLQWGCPVASSLEVASIPPFTQIPLPILEHCQMLPVQYAAKSQTLYLACGQRIDHAAFYAIEKMIDCHAQPCVGGRKSIAWQLERLRQQPRPYDVEFGPVRDVVEMSRIGLSYVTRLGAEEIRTARVGALIWLRLKAGASCTNLMFRLRAEAQSAPIEAPPFVAGPSVPFVRSNANLDQASGSSQHS
jgi:hypothetical protein